MKTIFAPLVFALFVLAHSLPAQQAIHPFTGYDIDTSHHEWTALAVLRPGQANGRLLISSVEHVFTGGQPMGQPVGDIRLQFFQADQPTVKTRSVLFPGKARVYDIQSDGQDFWIAGGFVDTLTLGSTMLTSDKTFHFDPFIARLDTAGNVLWVWSDHYPAQNHFVQRLRINSGESALVASGMGSDVEGWIGIFDAQTGAKTWAETFPAVRIVADAGFVTLNTPSGAERRLWFTGACNPASVVGGDTTPDPQPVTGYTTFLARMDTGTRTAEVLSGYSHITFDFDAQLLPASGSSAMRWKTTAATEVVGLSGLYTFIETLPSAGAVTCDSLHASLGSVSVMDQGLQTDSSGLFLVTQHQDSSPWKFQFISVIDPAHTHYDFDLKTPGLHAGWMGVHSAGHVYLGLRAGTDFTIDGESFTFPQTDPFRNRWVLLFRGLNPTNLTPERESAPLQLYPNPAREAVTIVSAAAGETGSWQVCDLAGRVLLTGQGASTGATIPLGSLSAGMYVVRWGKSAATLIRE